MNSQRRAVVVLAITLCAASAFAQKKPDFSGRWVAVSPADSAGEEQTFKQDATTLTMSHASEGPDHVFVYELNGQESRRTMASHGQSIVTLAKATWEGDRLVITEKSTYPDGRQLDQKQVISLDDKGQLVIDLTATMTGQPTQTIKLVHRKK